MKVLFIADAVIQSGFSVVTHNICNYLHKYCDVVVYGIRYDGYRKHPYTYYIYPASRNNSIYSFSSVEKIMIDERPDVAVIFNDANVICNYLPYMINDHTRLIPMFPVNVLPADKESILEFSNSSYGISDIISYTKFSAGEIKRINPNFNVTPVYHGVNTDLYKKLFGFKEEVGLRDYFIVGNVSTNTYRKRLDLFLKGFALFAKGKNDVKCLLHCNDTASYNLLKIAEDLGVLDKVMLSKKQVDFPQMVQIYNMMNVIVNTSVGEGLGLPLLEAAACEVPVLCPKHENLVDVWGENADYINIKDYEYLPEGLVKGAIIDIEDMAYKLERLYRNKEHYDEMSNKATNLVHTTPFTWESVGGKVYDVLSMVNNNRCDVIS